MTCCLPIDLYSNLNVLKSFLKKLRLLIGYVMDRFHYLAGKSTSPQLSEGLSGLFWRKGNMITYFKETKNIVGIFKGDFDKKI